MGSLLQIIHQFCARLIQHLNQRWALKRLVYPYATTWEVQWISHPPPIMQNQTNENVTGILLMCLLWANGEKWNNVKSQDNLAISIIVWGLRIHRNWLHTIIVISGFQYWNLNFEIFHEYTIKYFFQPYFVYLSPTYFSKDRSSHPK